MPRPTLSRSRIFPRQGVRKADARNLVSSILHPDRPGIRDLCLQCCARWLGQHDDPILASFAFAHDDDPSIEVDVFDPQAQAFHQAKSCTVQKSCDGRTAVVDIGQQPYEPQDRGWIGISNAWGSLAHIDCRGGGAQKVFTDLCYRFEMAGWQLERRTYDWQFVRKGNVRWEIRIGVLAPGQTQHSGWGDPM